MGPQIRARRKELGLTATDAAAKSGLSLAQYSRIELDKAGRPYPATLRRIALALGMPELWLINGDEPTPPAAPMALAASGSNVDMAALAAILGPLVEAVDRQTAELRRQNQRIDEVLGELKERNE
jgi:transcriptional regulator with XRE-family HTH domain